jgi:hypothetical protein
MYSRYEKTLHVGRAKLVSSYKVMLAHHTPCGHTRDSTGTVPFILDRVVNFLPWPSSQKGPCSPLNESLGEAQS